jgi:hypothetical protein
LIIGRSGKIRTCDPLVPNQMRYQTALRSDCGGISPQFAGTQDLIEQDRQDYSEQGWFLTGLNRFEQLRHKTARDAGFAGQSLAVNQIHNVTGGGGAALNAQG